MLAIIDILLSPLQKQLFLHNVPVYCFELSTTFSQLPTKKIDNFNILVREVV